jgi:hypothetical protein
VCFAFSNILILLPLSGFGGQLVFSSYVSFVLKEEKAITKKLCALAKELLVRVEVGSFLVENKAVSADL